MASDKRSRVTGRRTDYEGPFASLPHAYFKTPEFARLSFRARALLIEMALMYWGSNNGSLVATHSTMRPRGFGSKDQLSKALHELLARGWIQVTRQGGRTRATLYALTYRRIDPCRHDFDVRPGPPSHLWRDSQAQWRESSRDLRSAKRGFAGLKAQPPRNSLASNTGHDDPSHGARVDHTEVHTK